MFNARLQISEKTETSKIQHRELRGAKNYFREMRYRTWKSLWCTSQKVTTLTKERRVGQGDIGFGSVSRASSLPNRYFFRYKLLTKTTIYNLVLPFTSQPHMSQYPMTL